MREQDLMRVRLRGAFGVRKHGVQPAAACASEETDHSPTTTAGEFIGLHRYSSLNIAVLTA